MRLIGTTAMGIRLPIISKGDDLISIICDTIKKLDSPLKSDDIIGVTEAIVAKSESNYAKIEDIAEDIKHKYGDNEIALIYPIFSRNRFLNILKGIAKGTKKVHVLFSYPFDEVGNPILDINRLDDILDALPSGLVSSSDFKKVAGEFLHPFTNTNYIDLYESVQNVSVYFSNDPRDALNITKNILVGEIHSRNRTKARLIKAGADTIYTLSDILSTSINGSGFNSKYGVLGSNLSSDNTLKLFPNKADEFVLNLQAKIKEITGVAPEVLVYGDGAFKDPVCGIWELADPVVSPGFTKRLGGLPDELKIKLVADTLGDISAEEKQEKMKELIKSKDTDLYREGTTPRVYADLLGSLCDLVSGSGDKGTPVILIRGYFDNYSTQ